MNRRKALVFGSTGLIGNLLPEELFQSVEYQEIGIFVRQTTGISHHKVRETVFDFDSSDIYAEQIKGDDLFICLGTTIKKAGSVKKMEEIDRDLPIKIAVLATANGVKRIAVVSSLGAIGRSKNYYLRLKGEIEEMSQGP